MTPQTDKPVPTHIRAGGTVIPLLTGFQVFQRELETMINVLGGDELAIRATTEAFEKGVRHVSRTNDYGWGSWSTWTRMNDAQWQEAAAAGRRILRSSVSAAGGEGMLGDFLVVWDASVMVRPGKLPGFGIRLASAVMHPEYDSRSRAMKERWSVSWDDAGEYLAKKRGRGPKAKVTYADSEASAVRTIARIAKELGVV